jgi:hypothetical protein
MICLIADVAAVRPYVLAADLLPGKDQYARLFLSEYRRRAGKTTG